MTGDSPTDGAKPGPKKPTNGNNTTGNTNGVTKGTKKRRSLSCTTCRKLKTRCDFVSSKGLCHRCDMLRLPCSLASEPTFSHQSGSTTAAVVPPPGFVKIEEDESGNNVLIGPPSTTTSTTSTNNNSNSSNGVERLRLDLMEKNMNRMMGMLESMQGMMGRVVTEREEKVSQEYDDSAPLVVIREIDYKLFGRHERYEPVREASEELCNWINQRQAFCQEMAEIFRSKCGEYLISTTSIMQQTPLLAGIMILQGMRCDDKSTHDEEQPKVFDMVRKVLSTALMTSPLHWGDIEAMLYMAIFNPARKPTQPIFDSWLLTSYGMKMFTVSVPFGDLINRVMKPNVANSENDLYLMRMWNMLCLCHLQYAVASGKPVLVDNDHLQICQRITGMPGRSAFDVYCAAEMRLLEIQSRLQRGPYGQFAELEEWKKFHWHHVESDPLKSLGIGYDYCRAVLACRHLKNHLTDETAYQTALEASASIIRQFLEMPASQIEGLPNYPMCILIYAALTLCRYITHATDRHATLTLMTRIYWYLYHIGDQPRDIVHTISNIIKSLLESAPAEPPIVPTPMPLSQPTVTHPYAGSHQQQQQQHHHHHANGAVPNAGGVIEDVPDISQYSTYDEYFEGVFAYMQGNAVK